MMPGQRFILHKRVFLMTFAQFLLLASGVLTALAGGGKISTFSAMLAIGMPAALLNAETPASGCFRFR